MSDSYESWIQNVTNALQSINMSMQHWQKVWAFDFRGEFSAGTSANEAAMKANKYWWFRQNQTMGQSCIKTAGCWLLRNHGGECDAIV